MMAIVHNGDAMNPEDIEKAFVAIDGVDAVVSTLGGTTADPSVDSQASLLTLPACICTCGLMVLSSTVLLGSRQWCPLWMAAAIVTGWSLLSPFVMHSPPLNPANLPFLGPKICLQGNINLIEAALRHGVKKFVLVTSIGTGG
jgi:hypothetical protein